MPLMGVLASAILSKQFTALCAHEAGTRDGSDPEELHDMRVATRRLRAALRLFAPALAPTADHFRQELAWLGRGLSSVRDLDVQLARLADWRSEVPDDDRAVLDTVIAAITGQRDRARGDLLALMDSSRYAGLLESCGILVQTGPTGEWATGRTLVELPRLIDRFQRKVRKCGDRLDGNSPADELHQLRIRAKRLRYAVEFAADLYGRPAERFVRRVVELQDLLGGLQDARLAVARMRTLATEESSILPKQALFVLGELAQRYADEGLALRSQFDGAYSQLTGQDWDSLRERMRARRKSARDRQAPPASMHGTGVDAISLQTI
jgi:CHAD domain-containing protein